MTARFTLYGVNRMSSVSIYMVTRKYRIFSCKWPTTTTGRLDAWVTRAVWAIWTIWLFVRWPASSPAVSFSWFILHCCTRVDEEFTQQKVMNETINEKLFDWNFFGPNAVGISIIVSYCFRPTTMDADSRCRHCVCHWSDANDFWRFQLGITL